jgi:hypothetical protein
MMNLEVDNGRMTAAQMDDLLKQKALFDQYKHTFESVFFHEIVGYVAGNQRSAHNAHVLLDRAKATFPGRMIYFEPIGFDLF